MIQSPSYLTSMTDRARHWARLPISGQEPVQERTDLGNDIRTIGSGRLLRKSQKPTSILLDEELLERLREKGAKRGLGYQTMLKVIVREHPDDY